MHLLILKTVRVAMTTQINKWKIELSKQSVELSNQSDIRHSFNCFTIEKRLNQNNSINGTLKRLNCARYLSRD